MAAPPTIGSAERDMALLLIDIDCARPIAGIAAQAADTNSIRERFSFTFDAPDLFPRPIWNGYRSYAGTRPADAEANITTPQPPFDMHFPGRDAGYSAAAERPAGAGPLHLNLRGFGHDHETNLRLRSGRRTNTVKLTRLYVEQA